MLCLHLFVIQLVSGQLPPAQWTNEKPGKQEPEEMMRVSMRDKNRQERSLSSQQGNHECQHGNPLGVNYVGGMNKTVSGRDCMPGNHCRNPADSMKLSLGVWCDTTDWDRDKGDRSDPDYHKRWEICDVPICDATYSCQEGEPLGATYVGSVNVTASGKACMGWHTVSSSYWYLKLGEHNYCRNPGQPFSSNHGVRPKDGVWCYTSLSDEWEYCDVRHKV